MREFCGLSRTSLQIAGHVGVGPVREAAEIRADVRARVHIAESRRHVHETDRRDVAVTQPDLQGPFDLVRLDRSAERRARGAATVGAAAFAESPSVCLTVSPEHWSR